MSGKYTAIMENENCYSTSENYWVVEITTNSLETLNKVCEALNSLNEEEGDE